MYLDQVISRQKQGQASGIASICSAHPRVLAQALATLPHPLIEATCNQVNQFGGYTGMTPRDFATLIRDMAATQQVPAANILLGGDHLGPHVWQAQPADAAMSNARVMVADYVKAGFTKIHLDCSMALADDPPRPLDVALAADRAADLAQVAEQSGGDELRYVIGTEVPLPGGAQVYEEGVHVTEVRDVRETVLRHQQAFQHRGLQSAWERVIAVVVQPGVEYGDDFVLPYDPGAARELSAYIQHEPLVYEAHSTDYQTEAALKALVRDHFAILKVGPALTFAYREAVFSLAMIEEQWFPADQRSNLIQVLDASMTAQPGYWRGYYRGTELEQAFKRKFSLSDRSRYYWSQPDVQVALGKLMHNLGSKRLPYSLSSQFLGDGDLTAEQAIDMKIASVLRRYAVACGEES